MIPAAEFKAAVQEMLDALGDGLVDADTIKARFDAMLDAVPERPVEAGKGGALPGALRGSLVWMSDDLISPVDPDWEAAWEANNPPELYR